MTQVNTNFVRHLMDRYYNHPDGIAKHQGDLLFSLSEQVQDAERNLLKVFATAHQRAYSLNDFRTEWECHHSRPGEVEECA